MADEFITIARVIKPQGRLGEVAADILTDFPERFAERTRVFALDDSGARRELQVEAFWPHKQRLVLKFKGVDSIDDAEALVGCEIQVPRAERSALEAGSAYVGDLVGCEVFVSGAAVGGQARLIGAVADVQFGAGEAPLLVVRQDQREFLIPLAQEYLRKLAPEALRIEMELPEGMLDLDAPLSQEEKDAQKKTSS
ncbi:MAG: ribosome maturation factor RimM [Terriglobales bacterium]